jgi:hypothetical protein
VSSELRLHLAIAERDRYVLTSIEVECVDGGDGAELLRRFTKEFTPEQIKRFLARDVIGHLPVQAPSTCRSLAGPTRRAHMAILRTTTMRVRAARAAAHRRQASPRSFDVTLSGRWTEMDASAATSMRKTEAASAASPRTPLAGSRLEIEIEDADGNRHLTLSSVVPNRRYVIGMGEGCDITVNGTFASRRHCEIWLENGSWWAGDAGSTNGIRVESAHSVLAVQASSGRGRPRRRSRSCPGARIVLSGSRGKPADYPRVLLNRGAHLRRLPCEPRWKRQRSVTPIAAPRRINASWR